MSRWWRAYDDALHDPKVQGLPPVLFKFWFNVLCAASKNDGVIPPSSELKGLLKARSDYVEAHLKDLLSRGLIDEVDGHLEPHNWRKRQYKSDSSAARTRSWRDSKRDVTKTVTVTPPEYRVQSTEKKDAAPTAPLLFQPQQSAEAELFARGKKVLGKTAGGLIAKLIRAKDGNLSLARAAIEQASTKENPSEYIARIVHGPSGKKLDMNDPQDVERFILS